MAPGQGQQQQAMGMTPSVVPAPTAGVPGAGMQMMGQSGAPQGAVPAMQQQGMYGANPYEQRGHSAKSQEAVDRAHAYQMERGARTDMYMGQIDARQASVRERYGIYN